MIKAKVETIKLKLERWFFVLKRCARKLYRHIGGQLKGFTLFSMDAEKWLKLTVMESNSLGYKIS